MMRRTLCLLSGLGLGLAAPRAIASPTEPGALNVPLQAMDDCAMCHVFPNAPHMEGEARYDPMSYLPSLMANAARDPVFWGGVAIAAQDEPGGTEQCVRCHAPRAFLDGLGHATELDELPVAYQQGIDCALCHRMEDDGATPPGNAQYVVHDAPGTVVPFFGPWNYEGAELVPPHETASSDLLASSRLCGTCHDVSTERERVDPSGASLGTAFNEQRTYSEWLRSDYAQVGENFASCQDCHMPAVEDVAGCALFSEQGLRHEQGGRRHEMLGANRFMLTLLRDLYSSGIGGPVPDEMFAQALERTDEFLAGAATLEVDFPDAIDLQAGVDLGVQVTNNTGHKLPSGYSEGRVMWLEVRVEHAGIVLMSSGRWDPSNASYPDGIEDDTQIRRYEGVAEDADDGTRLHLLRNNRWVVDNRIPPKGLQGHIDTDPVGERYSPLPDGSWPNQDEVEYSFEPFDVADPSEGEQGEATIRVRLLYLINTPSYIEFLGATNTTNASGERVGALFAERGGADPVLLAEFSKSVPVAGFVEMNGEESESESGNGEPTGGGGGGGCGCDAGSKRRGGILWLGLLGLGLSRRRGEHRLRARSRGGSRL